MFGKKGSNGMTCVGCGSCAVCKLIALVLMILSVLGTIAALIGVYKAHFLAGGAAFGTTNGSLALVALALMLFLLKKAAECCPCRMEK